MRVLHLSSGRAVALAVEQEVPKGDEGFYWLDLDRSDTDWQERAGRWMDTRLHERHFFDSLNARHPPFYDGTDEYDMLIMRTLDPESPTQAPMTHPVALFVFERAVVTVRPPGDDLFGKVHERLLTGQRKAPPSSAALLAMLLNEIVDRLLARRDAVSELLADWQERLLDREDVFNDWESLMRLRNHMRRIEVVSESQIDALMEWREQTDRVLDEGLNVRFNDLQEHLNRVFRHASVMQADIDSLVQIYFSASSQRTNEILQFLTVLSAIFLPLNLIAGVFGMNFESMPLLHLPGAGGITILLMALIAVGLLYWSRKKRLF